jgi:hypothetical protein
MTTTENTILCLGSRFNGFICYRIVDVLIRLGYRVLSLKLGAKMCLGTFLIKPMTQDS